jgi:hypothetical protein
MTESIIKFLEKLKAEILAKYADGLENISGHNGPYKDVETGVRAQAHLIVLLSNLDKSKQSTESLALVGKLVSDLLNSPHRLDTIVFNQRTKPGKDEVNGVIGIAWIMEAMCCAYEVYKNQEAKAFLEKAEDGLRFNTKRGLWYRPVLKDSKYYNTIDETFNHQLWLAYALVYKSAVLKQEVSANVATFFKKLNGLMKVHGSGMVKHAIVNASTPQLQARHILKSAKDGFNALLKGKSFKYKEYGYHLFNMFAFARMVDLGYGSLFSTTPAYVQAKKFCLSQTLYQELITNKDNTDFYMQGKDSGLEYNRYGLPYNVAGFEFLYVNHALELGADKQLQQKYFDAQLNCYGLIEYMKKGTGNYTTEDLPNLMLRSYELSFILN